MLIARNVSERVFYLELNSARNKDLIYQINWGRGFSEQPPTAFYPVQRSALICMASLIVFPSLAIVFENPFIP